MMEFHFIRPAWLFLIPFFLYGIFLFWKQSHTSTHMNKWINSKFIPLLQLKENNSAAKTPYIGIAILATLALLALAGPTSKKLPQPTYNKESILVIALDLSPSMLATDNKPTRLARAKLKIQELLNQRQEGNTGLIVFGGEAFIVSPLTKDTETISNLLPSLTPEIIPLQGSNIEMAIQLANELINDGPFDQSTLLIVTDGILEESHKSIIQNIDKRFQPIILGIGSDKGAPIPNGKSVVKDNNGNIILAKRNSKELLNLSTSIHGIYIPIQADDKDINLIINQLDHITSNQLNSEEREHQFDQWVDLGPLLVLLGLPLLAFAFRRGWIIHTVAFLPITLLLHSPDSQALSWDSLWKNNDKRGLSAWEKGDYDAAATLFNDSQWKASSQYKSEKLDEALLNFEQENTDISLFNQGNTLARLNRLDEAIKAYEKALEKNPNFTEAKANKEYLEKIKQSQENKSNNNQDNTESSDNSQRQNDENDGGEKDSNQNHQSEQSSENDESSNSQNKEKDKTDNKEEKDTDQASKEEKSNDTKNENSTDNSNVQSLNLSDNDLTPEQEQALEQWLRKVPDDPSGLMRRKFEYEFRKRKELYRQGKWSLPENEAHKRY